MRALVPPALAYVAAVFAVAFALGTLRVLFVAPRLGDLAAVACEIPLVLGTSWVVAGAVLRRWPIPSVVQRAAMGAIAFDVLMTLEAGLAYFAFGQSLSDWFSAMTHPAGLLGLAGQLGFAAIPALRGRPEKLR